MEILKVLYRGARTLILDEPTAVLVPQEVDELFGALRGLKEQGMAIIFISHKLDEVLKVADEITVIRRGTTVASVLPGDVTSRQLAELMVGSELPSPETRESTVTDRAVLTVNDLGLTNADGRVLLSDISFTIHAGEILGIAGVEGNGQAELVETLLGMRHAATGHRAARRRGHHHLVHPSTSRERHRLHPRGPDASRPAARVPAVGEPDAGSPDPAAQLRADPFLDPRGAKKDTQRIVDTYDVRTPSIDVLASALSGGNQQKLIVGREMSADPKVLLAAHPTRGVDVGAQAAIWDLIKDARGRGLAVLLISADLDELIGLSDSLKVMLRGTLVADMDPAHVTPEDLGTAMTGAGGEAA